jgi:hypothetical protein
VLPVVFKVPLLVKAAVVKVMDELDCRVVAELTVTVPDPETVTADGAPLNAIVLVPVEPARAKVTD